MPLVFSSDALFLHVPKTGGASVSRFLLQALPRPVTYVGPNRVHNPAESGVVYVYGKAHQTLPEARDFLRERGIGLANFQLIFSAVRNPYDFMVSYYAYNRRPGVRYELINEWEAPPGHLAPVPSVSWKRSSRR